MGKFEIKAVRWNSYVLFKREITTLEERKEALEEIQKLAKEQGETVHVTIEPAVERITVYP